MQNPDKIQRIISKLENAWAKHPNMRLGELLEKVEDIAWDFHGERYVSARLMNLPDEYFELALNVYNK